MTTIELIRQTAQTLDQPTSVVSAVGLTGINEALSAYGWADGALLLYSLQSNGSMSLSGSGKARLTENVTLSFAFDCKRNEQDAEDKLKQSTGLAVQFMQKLIRQEAFKVVPENNTIEGINMSSEIYSYNGQYALVTLTFNLTFDPSIKTPKC